MDLLKRIKTNPNIEIDTIDSTVAKNLVESKLVGVIGGKMYLKEDGERMIVKSTKDSGLLGEIEAKIEQLTAFKSELEAKIAQEQVKYEEPTMKIAFQATIVDGYTSKDYVCPSCMYKGPMSVNEAYEQGQEQEGGLTNDEVAVLGKMGDKSFVPNNMEQRTKQGLRNQQLTKELPNEKALQALQQHHKNKLANTEQKLRSKVKQIDQQQATTTSSSTTQAMTENIKFGPKMNEGVRNYKRMFENHRHFTS